MLLSHKAVAAQSCRYHISRITGGSTICAAYDALSFLTLTSDEENGPKKCNINIKLINKALLLMHKQSG